MFAVCSYDKTVQQSKLAILKKNREKKLHVDYLDDKESQIKKVK